MGALGSAAASWCEKPVLAGRRRYLPLRRPPVSAVLWFWFGIKNTIKTSTCHASVGSCCC